MVVIAAPRIVSAARVNYVSLQQFPAILHSLANRQQNLEMSASHPREAYWRAAQAKSAEDWGTVLALMKPLADSGDRYALGFVGLAYESQGNFSSAVGIWQQLGYWQELYRVGQVARRGGQREIAMQAYIASWEINPKFATNQLASLLLEEGDLIAAERVYRRAISVISPYDQRQPSWHQGLARLLMKQQRWSEAIASWEHVIRIAHLNEKVVDELDRIYYEMAWAYSMIGQHEEAVAAIEQAVEHESGARYLLRAGKIYEASGDVEEALDAYRQVLATNPNHQAAQEAIGRLENGP